MKAYMYKCPECGTEKLHTVGSSLRCRRCGAQLMPVLEEDRMKPVYIPSPVQGHTDDPDLNLGLAILKEMQT